MSFFSYSNHSDADKALEIDPNFTKVQELISSKKGENTNYTIGKLPSCISQYGTW